MLKKLLLFLFILNATAVFANNAQYIVNTSTLKVRTGPSSHATHLYSIYKGKEVTVYEMKKGWASISKKTPSNKWVFAKYLSKINSKKQTSTPTPVPVKKKIQEKKQVLKQEKPRERKELETKKEVVKKKSSDANYALIKAITPSDDYEKYKHIFIPVSIKLYEDGICKIKNFRKIRGWIALENDITYYTYCGGYNRKNKIYINVITGEVFQ